MNRSIALFLKAILLQLALFSCSPPSDGKEQAARQQKDDLRREVLAMAAKHGADFKWMKVLEKDELYTIELQQALLQAEKPRLLLSPIVDVIQQGDAYVLKLHDWMGFPSSIYYELHCNAEQSNYVLATANNGSRMFQDYALVMLPSSVQKPLAKFICEDDGDGAYVTDEASDIMVVKGACIDLVSLKAPGLSARDLIEATTEQSK